MNTPNLIGFGYYGSDGAATCCLCDYELEWEDCFVCCGDGVVDASEDDPLNYSPGEEVTCSECRGDGGSYYCRNKECRTFECRRILPSRKAAEDVAAREPRT